MPELTTILPGIGPTTPSYSAPSADQDPVFDHTNGTKTSVTTSGNGITIITPPTGCKYVRITPEVDILIRTDSGSTPISDNGISTIIKAGFSDVIPVIPGVPVRALAITTGGVVRCTPLKVR